MRLGLSRGGSLGKGPGGLSFTGTGKKPVQRCGLEWNGRTSSQCSYHNLSCMLNPYSPAITLFLLPWIWAALVLPFFLKCMSYSDYSTYILDNQSNFHQAFGITGFFTGVWKVPGSKPLSLEGRSSWLHANYGCKGDTKILPALNVECWSLVFFSQVPDPVETKSLVNLVRNIRICCAICISVYKSQSDKNQISSPKHSEFRGLLLQEKSPGRSELIISFYLAWR